MPAPVWAERVVRDAARIHRRRPPLLRWRTWRRLHSAGSACSANSKEDGAISIVSGRNPLDQRLVLCHELAHWLGRAGEGHTDAFWRRAWHLYRRFRVPVYYALAREGDYAGAVEAYRKHLDRRRQTNTTKQRRTVTAIARRRLRAPATTKHRR